jgi:uncharacterized RDD family membrane protein YckC
VEVGTGNNVKHVSTGTRLAAFLLDYVIIACYLCLLVGVSLVARPLLMPLFTTNPIVAEITGFLFITLPVYLYFALSEGAGSHATWGKRRMGIAVAGVHGEPIGLGTSLFRSALKFFPWELAHFTIWQMAIPAGLPDYWIYSLLAAVYGLVLIYLLSPIWSKKNQTVYDFMAGTVVRYE